MIFKRVFAFLLTLLITISCFTVFVSADESDTSAVQQSPGLTSGNAAIAYCIDDEQFLYTDRIDERVAPTVATKLMTSMVVADILRERSLNAEDVIVTVTSSAVENAGNVIDVRVPKMGFDAGSTYTAKDLLSATLVACANDAAAALACHFGEVYLGGDINTFVERMNKKAEALGLQNTNFTNPTGLDSPEQYTTPREVTLIASAFYGYNELVRLADVEHFLLNNKTTVRNKNFLKSGYYVNGYTNKNAIGLIAGQLDLDGNYCLITASQKDGRTYIFVVMCASSMIVERIEEQVYYSFGAGNAYDDMNKLISWTRDSFELLSIATSSTIVGELRVNLGSSTDHVMVVPAEDVERLVIATPDASVSASIIYDDSVVYKKEFNGVEYDTVNAPITAGQRVGTIVYSYNGLELARVDAVAREGVESDGVKASLDTAKNFLFGPVMKTVLYVIGGIIVLYVLITVITAVVKTVKKVNKGVKGRSANPKKQAAKKKKDSKKPETPKDNAATREF